MDDILMISSCSNPMSETTEIKGNPLFRWILVPKSMIPRPFSCLNLLGEGEKSDRSCILDNNSYHFWRAYWLSACQVLACKPGLDVNQIIQVSQCSCSGFVKWTTNNRKFCIWLLWWQNAGWPQFKDFCFQLFLQNKALWLTFLVISQINLMHFSPSRHHGTIGSVLILEEDGGGLQSLNGCEN